MKSLLVGIFLAAAAAETSAGELIIPSGVPLVHDRYIVVLSDAKR